MREDRWGTIGIVLYVAAAVMTFGYLTFFSGLDYTWWNWPIVGAGNYLASVGWPYYWAIEHWQR